jgi:hypothetical protein
MFAIYEVIDTSLTVITTNLKFIKKCESLSEVKAIYIISDYKLANDGWALSKGKIIDTNDKQFLILDIESKRISRSSLISLVRDIKIVELLG